MLGVVVVVVVVVKMVFVEIDISFEGMFDRTVAEVGDDLIVALASAVVVVIVVAAVVGAVDGDGACEDMARGGSGGPVPVDGYVWWRSYFMSGS